MKILQIQIKEKKIEKGKRNVGLGAVKECANVVDFEHGCKNDYLLATLGFDKAKNEPSKVGRFLIGAGGFMIREGSLRRTRFCGIKTS